MHPKIGQIVHFKENLPRRAWKLGKIIKLTESEDGEIRAATSFLPTRNRVVDQLTFYIIWKLHLLMMSLIVMLYYKNKFKRRMV